MKHSVASVPFLNAKPLVWALEQWPEQFETEVRYELPSRLPAELDSGKVEAVLVSSIDALTVPGRRIADGCSISSHGPVMSVRLFSRVPFGDVETLALDASSMTSNALAQIVLAELFRVRPQVETAEPDGAEMLEHHDACVLIGDKGLMFRGRGLYEVDLGEAWKQLTGLPFVWACWVGTDALSPDLVGLLVEARALGEQNLAHVAGLAPPDIPAQLAHKYLTQTFDYSFGRLQRDALMAFADRIVRLGLAPDAGLPILVAPSATPAGVN